ncbi:hypothetical protein BZG36_04154 [Bifiguratus adelaidae]|uniref:Large ribosomal subunit protein uL23m n=1 Tax=Bifiguratus adelaidae TaxID=1938954 RepID=A0A261XZG3_9FUNG|nr:hypothetical protein BZG36_04154 [Bifiguratus adelaidae]
MASVRQGLKKVYLPNIIFKMVRTPNLQPNQVAFRVPPNVNKLDITSYLTNIYNVTVKDVRTMNYPTVVKRRTGREVKKSSAYKKAIVTVSDECAFTFPPEPDPKEFGLQAKDLGKKQAERKLKGWRIRAQPEERARRAEYEKEAAEKANAEAKQT